jgi:hypothetical protein
MPKHTVGLLVGADGKAPKDRPGDVCAAPMVSTWTPSANTMGTDQIGALIVYTFLRGWGVDHDPAFATAQAWTGDFIRLQLGDGGKTTAIAWRIEFSAQPPADIVTRLTASKELAVTPGPRSLEITVSDSPTPLTWKPAEACP